jgi:hypothetical protein
MDIVEKRRALIRVLEDYHEPFIKRYILLIRLRNSGVLLSNQELAAVLKSFEQIGLLSRRHYVGPCGNYECGKTIRIAPSFHERCEEAIFL